MPEAAVSHLPAPKPSAEPQTSTGEHDGKLDFKKELAERYNPKNRDWEVVDVPAMNFQSMIWHSTGGTTNLSERSAKDVAHEAQDHLAAAGETSVKIP